MENDKRCAKRVKVHAIISLNAVGSNDNTSNDLSADNEKINVTVLDISESGLAFTTDRKIEINSFYDANLNFEGCGQIKAVLQIVRTDDKTLTDGNVIYGSRFIGMNSEDRFRINVYRLVKENTM